MAKSPKKGSLKGFHTKPNVWDQAHGLGIYRDGEKLDPGVNYFVLMLDQLDLPTHYSCEGHPDGFYIMFEAPYEQALELKQAGYFSVEVEGQDYWSVRRHHSYQDDEKQRVDAFRWAADAWETKFGPLDFDSVELVRGSEPDPARWLGR